MIRAASEIPLGEMGIKWAKWVFNGLAHLIHFQKGCPLIRIGFKDSSGLAHKETVEVFK